jgi:hypothetical protein
MCMRHPSRRLGSTVQRGTEVRRFPLGWEPREQLVQELDGSGRFKLVRLGLEPFQELLAGSNGSHASSTARRQQLGHRLISIRPGAGERERSFSHYVSSRHDASFDRTRQRCAIYAAQAFPDGGGPRPARPCATGPAERTEGERRTLSNTEAGAPMVGTRTVVNQGPCWPSPSFGCTERTGRSDVATNAVRTDSIDAASAGDDGTLGSFTLDPDAALHVKRARANTRAVHQREAPRRLTPRG